jgi:hypothetical protein
MIGRVALAVGSGLAVGGIAWWWLYGRYDEPGGLLGNLNQLLASVTSLGRGSRLTRAPYDTTTGVVPGDPDALAASAGVDVETYSLARTLASEEGGSDKLIKVAVAWSVLNYSRKRGRSVTAQVTRANDSNHAGSYGTYKNIDPASPEQGSPDRYASTALDPYADDAQIANAVITGSVADPTGGADQFDRPGGEKDPQYTYNKRVAAGAVAVNVPGIDPSEIRFWRTPA